MPRDSPSPKPSRRSRPRSRDRDASDRPGSDSRRDKGDRNYDRDRRSRYRDDDRERPRYSEGDDRRRGDGEDRYSRREGKDRDSDRDRYRERDRHREREREGNSRREPEWGARPSGSSRRSRSPRRKSTSRTGSRSPKEEDKAKPNFGASGLLAAETKTVKHGDGSKTVLKYHEPPEARKPSVGWRLYVFKDDNQSEVLHIHRQSAYLFGRDRAVVDVVLEHPSCSKQHAVIQFRSVSQKNEYGEVKAAVKPFIIDLESTNGTHVNGEAIPTSRYYELQLSDVIKFGESAREYVLLSEDAA